MSLHFLDAILVVQYATHILVDVHKIIVVKLCFIAMQVALFGSTESGKGDVWVRIAILGGIIGYIAKIYFT